MGDVFGSRHSRKLGKLEAELRRQRPEARDELVRSISGRVGARPTGVPRLALAGSMTALLLVALGSVGGISYAANAVNGAVKVVKKAVAPTAGQGAVVISGFSSGSDQYRPGYGWGDKNHVHTGPPGLNRRGGEAAPPLRARPAGPKARSVVTDVTVTEQATLFISVLDKNAKPLLLTQDSKRGGSNVGEGIDGPQTKFIRYTVLVPRAVPVALRIPSNLLVRGETYRIRVVAVDVDGTKSTLIIPFVA